MVYIALIAMLNGVLCMMNIPAPKTKHKISKLGVKILRSIHIPTMLHRAKYTIENQMEL